ncbi:glycosyltransferase family 4 protein [Roseateles saccharophilus]|uniref:Glycosyltransferase involved in cell wall biosynthesis n=1 Tax=Roseateles saccharophilus TaxID=304 RepID=A0A4R3URQ0_ROSSA|nr:glycosyltransferase family 4 protein [Roseateles saccharophilus]MDG0833423.1 glycosyltransferase [Roseateles saccharophilus]TCU93078.1 glycosyltransferase involved in cell wall biosynthesis [Roseateles saccharophilus]
MKVLIAHNAYQHRGGEDSVVADEAALLRSGGHEVELLAAHNDDIASLGRLDLVRRTLWSQPAAQEMRARCQAFRPDVVHVHNSFPLLSPAIHWAAAEAGAPVVQTLHNFRLLCPQAMLLREGRVCEDCVGRLPWRGAVRGCYRGSVAQSTVLAGMLVLHRGLGTWRRRVNRFIALNEFCRAKFIEGGLPAERVVIKPNFVDLPAGPAGERAGLLFVGRLSPEKGLDTLAAAAALAGVTVDVLGSGPLQADLAAAPGLRLQGPRPMAEVLSAMQRATALVLPSVWYENFPRTLVEAMASGLPVIASRLGAMAELVEDRVTGLLFEPGSPAALAQRLRWAAVHPAELVRMGANARAVYEARYTAARNLEQLLAIYESAIQEGPRRD